MNEKIKLSPKEYQRIHYIIKRDNGNAEKCENKNCKGNHKRIEWALKKGREYSENIDDYKQLCVKCHREYDLGGVSNTKEHNINISKSKKGIPIGVGKVLSSKHKQNISKGMAKKLKGMQIGVVLMLYYKGISMRKIAIKFNTNHVTISKYIKKELFKNNTENYDG